MKVKFLLLLSIIAATLLVGCKTIKKKAVFLNNDITSEAPDYETESQPPAEYDQEETTSEEKATEVTTEVPSEIPSEIPAEKPTEPPAEESTEIQTETPVPAPTVPITENPTAKPVEIPKITIDNISLIKGETGYTTSEVTTCINGSKKYYTRYKTLYYAKSPADAEKIFNDYVASINNGEFQNYMTLAVYCDDSVPYFENMIKEKNFITDNYSANSYNNYSPYKILKEKEFEKNSVKLNSVFSDFNTKEVNIVKSGNIYQIDFSFYLNNTDYQKCTVKSKEYAQSASGKTDYESIYNLCTKFTTVSYGVSDGCQSAYGTFFESKTIDEGIAKTIAMCLYEMGYEYRIEYASTGADYITSYIILVKLNGNYYYIEPISLLNGGINLHNNILIGKDVLKDYAIKWTDNETNKELQADVSVSYSAFPNFDDSLNCTCAGMLSETSYNPDAIIKSVLGEHYDESIDSYIIVPN